jgi:hypothetical protein
MSGFCSEGAACGQTLKASHPIAQGKRSGGAAKRHPGFGFDNHISTLKGLHKRCGTLSGFAIRPYRQPRAALRLPWVILFNRFAVGWNQCNRNENSPTIRASFPPF